MYNTIQNCIGAKILNIILITDQTWVDPCPLKLGWEVAQTIVFMVKDPIAMKQLDRMQSYLRDFAKTAEFGYVSFMNNVR